MHAGSFDGNCCHSGNIYKVYIDGLGKQDLWVVTEYRAIFSHFYKLIRDISWHILYTYSDPALERVRNVILNTHGATRRAIVRLKASYVLVLRGAGSGSPRSQHPASG